MPKSLSAPQPLAEQALTAPVFRRVAGNYATGIAIVTTVGVDAAHAMTANSFTTVSLNPLLVSFCVQHGTRFRDAVAASGCWAVSFLTRRQIPLARWFATTGRPLADQFHGIPIFAAGNGSPVLAESLAAIAATTLQSVTAGDHDIVIGQVRQLFARNPPAKDAQNAKAPGEKLPGQPELISDYPIQMGTEQGSEFDTSPCVYFQSAYGSWLREPPERPNI